jgi:hypothetical protein
MLKAKRNNQITFPFIGEERLSFFGFSMAKLGGKKICIGLKQCYFIYFETV